MTVLEQIRDDIKNKRWESAIRQLKTIEHPQRDAWIARCWEELAKERQAMIPTPPPQEVKPIEPMPSADMFACPHCAARTLSVSQIVQAGTTDEDIVGRIRPGLWGRYGRNEDQVQHTTIQTGLAKELSFARNAPPFMAERFEKAASIGLTLFGLLMLCSSNFSAILACCVIGVVIHYSPPLREARARHRAAYLRWEDARYCPDCSKLSVEGEGYVVKMAHFPSLLYAQESVKLKNA